jgi:hypothetical protein
MDTKLLVAKKVIGNKQQYCKGCEKNVSSSLFISVKRSYHTCNNCRIQNKAVYQRKSQKLNDQTLIEFYDFSDYLSETLDSFENTVMEDKENEENIITFSCTVNIITLEDINSKEKADHMIKLISDVDEYIWM